MGAPLQSHVPVRVPNPGYVVRDLARMSVARNYQRWQYDLIASHLGQRILEVGCGIGNFTQFLADRSHVHGIDIESACVDSFRKRYADQPHLTAQVMDVLGPEFVSLRSQQLDTVICLNVLEHIREDVETLRKFHAVLQPGGHVVLMVPAFQALYGPIDEQLGHYRRYTKKSLREAAEAAGFQIRKLRYFNVVGGIGWWVNARLIPRTEQSSGQIALFDSVIVPAMSAVDKILPLPFGQSVLGILEKGS